MLRMGKNESTNDKHETVPTTDPRTYSYQDTSAEVRPPVEANASGSRAISESESLARDIKEGTLSGFVGGGTVVTGEASFKAMMRIDGNLSGRVSSTGGTLIVGANGKVDANIEVAVGVIHGTVNGDIIASQRLELGRAAKVNGNIQTPSLVIEPGAIFEGSCKMIKMSSAVAKTKGNGQSERPLDTSALPPVNVDVKDIKDEKPEVRSITAIAS
jgi:cytoskeletal protein CcmA (bactofilin family)